MNKKIIITNGSGGCGKDTLYSFMEERSEFVTLKFSSIDYIKHIARDFFGWTGEKTEKDRKLLSDLKCLLSDYNDLPYRNMVGTLELYSCWGEWDVLVIDIREPKEIDRFVSHIKNETSYDVITVLIVRPDVKQITSNMADANVNNYNYDVILRNYGDLDNFHRIADNFIEEYIMGE